MKPIVFVDIETSGLNSEFHEILEVACIRIEQNGQRTVYHSRVHPLNIENSDQRALEINGYNVKDWRDASYPNEVASALQDFTKGAILIGHNIKFDVEFISELFANHSKTIKFDRRLIDTIVLAYEHLAYCGLESLSLDSIRAFLGWDTKGAHRALQDCKDVERLFYLLNRATVFDRLFWAWRHTLLKFFGLRK